MRIDAREPDAASKLDREGSTNKNPGRTSDDTAVPEDLGADFVDRANLGVRGPRLFGRLSEFPELGPGAATEIAALTATSPWTGSPVWVHGDLYPRHLLHTDGVLSGIIDWGDTHAGDPALDLTLGFTLLPPDAVPAFRAAYGSIDHDTWARARFHAWRYLLMIASYVRETGDVGMGRIVRWTAESLGVEVPRGMPGRS